MSHLDLPSVRVGYINVNWTNGSREKPLNPIPRDIIAKFEEKKDYKINWLSDLTGLITLEGNYNYLVFNENDFYFLEKTRVIDIDKLIFVYTLTKDVHQYLLNKPDTFIRGYLIKTNNEDVLWQNIQRTKAAISEVNSETVLHTCVGDKCDENIFGTTLEVVDFKRDKKDDGTTLINFFNKGVNGISQFGYKYRILGGNLKAFKDKLKYPNFPPLIKQQNQIFSHCRLTPIPAWENYIAKLVEDFFRNDVLDLTLSIESTLNTVNAALKKKLIRDDDKKNIYVITKKTPPGSSKQYETILTSAKTNDKTVKKIDLSQVKEIRLLDKALDYSWPLNKSIFDMTVTGVDPITSDSQRWFLKARMYGPKNIRYETYKHLPIANKIYEKNYSLNVELLLKFNLLPLNPNYVKHGFNFSNTFVPAFYYPTYLDVVTNENIKKKFEVTKPGQAPWSTEIGFLLNNIATYENTCFKGISNKHVYKGEPISLVTGIRFKKPSLVCTTVKQLKDGLSKDIRVTALFSDIYRDDINESFWLALLNSYLWWGQMDRSFVGLSPGDIDGEFKYTKPVCYIDDENNVWTADEMAKTADETNKDKLPTYNIQVIRLPREMTAFNTAAQILSQRRDNIQIKEEIYIPLIKGDIYWSSVAYGLFPERKGVYEASPDELIVKDPMLVVYMDSYYEYEKNKWLITQSINQQDYGFKYGILNKFQPTVDRVDKNNLILNTEPIPDIYYIRPLLEKTDPSQNEYDYALFEKDILMYLRGDVHSNPPLDKKYKEDLDRPAWWNKEKNYVWVYYNYRKEYDWVWLDYFELPPHWPTKDGVKGSRKWCLIEDVEYEKDGWVRLRLEDGHLMRLETRDKEVAKRWYNHLKTRYLKDSYIKKDSAVKANSTILSWPTLDSLNNSLLPDKTTFENADYKKYKSVFSNKDIKEGYDDGYLAHIISSTYTEINREKVCEHQYKYCDINKEYLQAWGSSEQEVVHTFEFQKDDKSYFYVLLKWPKTKDKPIIEILLADDSLVEDQPLNKVTLLPSFSLLNNNLVQVVNQQNFLYVHGTTFPIKTKMITNDSQVTFDFWVESLSVNDPIVEMYRVYFSGAGGDLIKTNVELFKPNVGVVIAQASQSDLANLKIDLVEQSEKRRLELMDNKERARVTSLSIKNQQEDLAWEQSMRPWTSAASWGSAIVGGGFTLWKNPIAGAFSLLSSAASLATNEMKTSQNFYQQERNIKQQEITAAFQIEQQKSYMDNSHKSAEMREKNRIYDMVNTIITPATNSTNVIEVEKAKYLGGKDIVILNRMPVGDLLDYLTDFHANFGYDIALNNFELSVKSFNDYDNQIYQFGRIDEISIDDLKLKDMIKNSFLAGVFLKKYKYKINQITYAQLKKEHEAKVAFANAEIQRQIKEDEDRRLSEIAAIEKGKVLATEEIKALVNKAKSLEDENRKISSEREYYKDEFEEATKKIATYDDYLNSEVDKLKAFYRTEQNQCIEDNEKLKKQNTELTTKAAEWNTAVNNLEIENQHLKDQVVIINNLEAENTRLDGENIDLQDKVDSCNNQLKPLKVKLAALGKKLGFKEGDEDNIEAWLQVVDKASEEVDKPGGPADNAALLDVLDELKKKKTSLAELRNNYTEAWNITIRYMTSGTDRAQYIRVWQQGTLYDLYVNRTQKGASHGITWLATLTINDKSIRVHNRNKPEEGFPIVPIADGKYIYLIPDVTHYWDLKDHSTWTATYQGYQIAINNRDINNRAQFMMWIGNNEWLNELKGYLQGIVRTSTAVRIKNKEIGEYILQNKALIPDADNIADFYKNLEY